MRQRSEAELNDPMRQVMKAAGVLGSRAPSYLRHHAAVEYGVEAIDFLAAVMRGEAKFDTVVITNVKGGGQNFTTVQMAAPGAVAVKAAEVLLRTAIPGGHANEGDGDDTPGAIALPQLGLMAAQARMLSGGEITMEPHPDGLTYVIEEETISAEARAEKPPEAVEETVNPEYVAHVLKRTRQNGDSGVQNPEPETGNGRQ